MYCLWICMTDTRCYVCLEKCVGERSPCVCGAPVHYRCFTALENAHNCTICREPYVFESFRLFDNPQTKPSLVKPRRAPATHPTVVILFYFAVWYCMGLVGKAVWLFSGGQLHYHVFAFWNMEHILAFMGTSLPFLAVCMFRKSVNARVVVNTNTRPVSQGRQTPAGEIC